MPERTPRLTAEELEALREATLQHYEAAGYPDELTDRLRAYTDEPDGGLINLIDMAIELARSHEAALARDPRTPEEDRPVDAQEAIARADREDRR
ncbi:hypothetical protein IU454_08095 [Nocardia farcinica]|uniref:hypothetical protein n=1 Tax=Nocardia farcinica TaxID=37329 RepID=UPI001894F19F|nr:hypothetical protein [Nocardia farcinica]MBF6291824.1 hypothetical protein [Nocardia farcinica]